MPAHSSLGVGRQILGDLRRHARLVLVNDAIARFGRLRAEREGLLGRPLRPLGAPAVAPLAELRSR